MTTEKAAVIGSIYTGADMIPYRGRLSLRVARAVLASAGLTWYRSLPSSPLIAYFAIALLLLPELRWQRKWMEFAVLVVDTAYFVFCMRFAPDSWISAASLSYLLTSAVLLHEFARAAIVIALLLILSLAPPSPHLAWILVAFASFASAVVLYKRHLNQRMSTLLRQNVAIRSQAETARDAERERIAADFHDGPLQSFASFQMRLEVIKKLLERDQSDLALREVHQLQDMSRNQVAELRTFARSMRPAEGAGLIESLHKMLEGFQRDTGITATCSTNGTAAAGPPESEQEILQILREALHNVQKHAGASRVTVSAASHRESFDLTVEDNGGGFPFSGKYTLDELERLHLGPISIKRRVRLLDGELVLESQPGRGAKLEIHIPG